VLGNKPVCTKSNTSNLSGFSRDVIPPAIQDRTGVTYKETSFDDSTWLNVNLPHDYIMNNTYSQTANSMHGYLDRNVIGR